MEVRIFRRYVPALNDRIPPYGVQNSGNSIAIAVGDGMPEEVIPLLKKELESLLFGMVLSSTSAVLYADRICSDYLQAHVLSGNMRFDSSKKVWRWVGGKQVSISQTEIDDLKQKSRNEDAEALRSGSKTREDLSKENSIMYPFKGRVSVHLNSAKPLR